MLQILRYKRNSLRLLGALSVLIMLPASFAAPAHADATYQYTGKPFSSFFGDDACISGVGQCQITGTVTFANALPDSLTIPPCCALNETALSWSFTDGFYTLNQTNSQQFFAFSTNSSGVITGWNFGLGTHTFCGTPPTHNCYVIEGIDAYGEHGDDSDDNFVTFSGAQSFVDGTWMLLSVTGSAPEPSALLLLATGLIGITAMRRRLAR